MTNDIKSFIWYISGIVNNMPEINKILEIGSLPACSQLQEANLRPLFKNKDYLGIDKIAGINVDKVMDAENLKGIPNNSINLILCLETIEHVEHPTRVASEMFRVLNEKHGVVIISTPMDAPVHFDPDYWRITPQGMKKLMLYGYKDIEVYIQGEENFPINIIGVGSKEKLPFKIKIDELNGFLTFPYPFPYKKYTR